VENCSYFQNEVNRVKRQYWIASLVVLLCVSLGINVKVGYDALVAKPDPAQVNGQYQSCLKMLMAVAMGLDEYLQAEDEQEKRLALYSSVHRNFDLQRMWKDVSPDVVELYGQAIPRVDVLVSSFNETFANYLMYDSLKGADVSGEVRKMKVKVDELIADLQGTSLEDEKSAERVFIVGNKPLVP
jgi:hypothetical protein